MVQMILNVTVTKSRISQIKTLKFKPKPTNRSGELQDQIKTLWNLRIQQLGKPRIVHHGLKVVVGARLEPVSGVQLNSPGQVSETILGAAGYRVQQRQAVERVVRIRMAVENAFELLPRLFVVTGIQLRDRVVEVFFGREESKTMVF